MIAIILANNIPGHLADPGRLSEIQELVRAPAMVMLLICEGILVFRYREEVDCVRKKGDIHQEE
jgi:hypothetical protein